MVQTLVGMGLKLHDIGGLRGIDALDQAQLLNDLREAGVPARQRVWLSLQPLDSFDRIMLALDCHGKCEGMLLVQSRTTALEPFLVIEALSGVPTARGEALLQRMLAYLILRLNTLEEQPVALMARTRNPSLCRVLHRIAGRIGSAGFYPEPDAGVVQLSAAALAHRLARSAGPDRRFEDARDTLRTGPAADAPVDGPMLVVLDLRFGNEMTQIEDARRLLRARISRLATRPMVPEALPLPLHDFAVPPAHVATPVGTQGIHLVAM